MRLFPKLLSHVQRKRLVYVRKRILARLRAHPTQRVWLNAHSFTTNDKMADYLTSVWCQPDGSWIEPWLHR